MMINDHELRDFTFQFILIVLFIWLKILSLELPFFVLWSSAVCESWTFIFWLLMGQFLWMCHTTEMFAFQLSFSDDGESGDGDDDDGCNNLCYIKNTHLPHVH